MVGPVLSRNELGATLLASVMLGGYQSEPLVTWKEGLISDH